MMTERDDSQYEIESVSSPHVSKGSTRRSDADYEIESLSKGLSVLEALEGTAFEPVTQKRIEQRTGFSRDLVMRTLKTLRLRGYAVQNERGEWTIGRRFIQFVAKAAAKGDL